MVLTGAGISAESGLSTFRGTNGTWNDVPIEEVATPEAYERDPARVHAFYDARRAQLAGVEPNGAHRALARLAEGLRERGGALALVTQNVDDLHERGGSTDVVHMHGRLTRARCTGSGHVHEWHEDLGHPDTPKGRPCPTCGAPLRPDIVWFGEVPHHLDQITDALMRADLFVAIGTSDLVYPAAGFVMEAREAGIPTLEINPEPSGAPFDAVRAGPATREVPDWVDEVLAG